VVVWRQEQALTAFCFFVDNSVIHLVVCVTVVWQQGVHCFANGRGSRVAQDSFASFSGVMESTNYKTEAQRMKATAQLPPSQNGQGEVSNEAFVIGGVNIAQEATECRRENLKEALEKKKSLLTPKEHEFLEHLCIHGDEIEVELAHEQLHDESIFFDDSSGVSPLDTTINSAQSVPVGLPPRPSLKMMRASSLMMGSQRRLDHLEERKRSLAQDSIWQAHAKGLSVTRQSSRRSLLVRRKSTASLDSKSDPRISQQIFRDVQNDGRITSGDGSTSNRRSSLKRPLFRRFKSDASRKSVTFQQIPAPVRFGRTRTTSDGSFGRSSSIQSIPSLGHGEPVRSTSGSSLPSLHLAKPVRSVSQASMAESSSEGYPYPTLIDETKVDDTSIPTKLDFLSIPPQIQNSTKLLVHDDKEKPLERLVLMRQASRNCYQGEGFEVADYSGDMQPGVSMSQSSLKSAISFEPIRPALSFEEVSQTKSFGSIFRRPVVRSLSDDNMAGIIIGPSRELLRSSISTRLDSGDEQWTADISQQYYDPWIVIEDEYENGYGGGGSLPFLILGTSLEDTDARPHVLSPPLMESLQAFLPQVNLYDNFFMKYSMLRHGASLQTMLQNARGATHTIIAVETTDGEVFGSFTSEPWRKNWNFFGSGESFLWRLRNSRLLKHTSILDQAQKESEIDVYPYTGKNDSIQLCTHDKIAVGGGTGDEAEQDLGIAKYDWGFGLVLDTDLLHGSSSPCMTFGSPSLSVVHGDGSAFEVSNVELWTLTPCTTQEEAEKLELGRLFLRKHGKLN